MIKPSGVVIYRLKAEVLGLIRKNHAHVCNTTDNVIMSNLVGLQSIPPYIFFHPRNVYICI